MNERDEHDPFYRPDYAPIPRHSPTLLSLLTLRETWVVVGGTLAGIVAAGAFIWLLLAVGAVLTER